MLDINYQELKLLKNKGKSQIINAGLRHLFEDKSFCDFWEDFWRTLPDGNIIDFISLGGSVRMKYLNLIGGIVVGLYIAQSDGNLPKKKLYLNDDVDPSVD